jgi:hypothetical protein
MAATVQRRLIAADSFDRVNDVVAELRHHGYTRLGEWTLPQVCFHLAATIEPALRPPATTEQTPGQAAAWRERFAEASVPGGLKPGRPCPNPALDPPPHCGDEQFDRLAAAYRAFAAYPHSHVTSLTFGPLPVDQSRRFHLAHASHHLSFLLPKPVGRAGLEYPDVQAALTDVATLRRGYRRAGRWSLAQIAHHLSASLRERMRPEAADEPDTAEQRARVAARDRVLNDNVIAAGLTAPPKAAPPADLTDDSDAGQAAIDDLVTQLERFDLYPGEFPPHRLFGRMTREQNRRHQLVHAAHHLSHLVPS